jgi:hypothetical protein
MTNQQPNPTPSWAQQPTTPGGWGPVPQPPKKKHRGLKIAGGVVGGIIVISIIAAATGGGSKPSAAAPAASSSQPATTTAPATHSAAPAAKPKPKATATTVLTEHGTGIKNTVKFTVHGDWDLNYTYNCASFGMQGNFAVTGMGGDFPDVMVNELGTKGTDTTHQHDGGTMYLQVNSECSWTIKAIDLP